MHDVTHYTAVESLVANKLFSYVVNLATAVPSAMAFGRYHWEHHQRMGSPIADVDLPTVNFILTISFIIK